MQIKKLSRNVCARLKQHHHRARITAPAMAKNDAAKPPMLKSSRRGEPEDEAAVGMEDVVEVLVGFALGEADGWTTVVSPDAVVVVRGVTIEVVTVDLLDAPEATEEVPPIAKPGLVAYTSLMLPMLTAWRVYPSPVGTTGSEMLSCWGSGFTLFAIAKALWKTVLTSSKDQVSGSPASEVHMRVTGPPEVAPAGACRVKAETRGVIMAAKRHRLNILLE